LARLEYTFTNDTLFKMIFVRHPDLLKSLVSRLLCIDIGSIGQFAITNPEMPPEIIGEKFCRLDISMTVDGQRVDLEIQVADEGDFPERSLYYWAREYSSALTEGGDYSALPRTIIISIVAFRLFGCPEFHSEFRALEASRHEPLTDKMSLHYFELPKLPDAVEPSDEQRLWLKLLRAQTEEDLREIKDLGVPIMEQAINAYRSVSATSEFRELERLRFLARANEASALKHAKREAELAEREKWQGVVTGLKGEMAGKDAALAEKNAALAEKNAALAEKNKLIAELQARLGEK